MADSIIKYSDGNAKQSPVYAWKSAAINQAGVLADVDLITISGFETLFSPFIKSNQGGVNYNVRKPYKIYLTTTGTTYVKINGGPIITISSTVPFSATDLQIDKIEVSDNGGNVTLTVQLQ